MITLGRFHYAEPVVLLAPMAGISDLPYRRICERLGANYTTAEMINARPDLIASNYSQLRVQFDANPSYPKIVQLAGGDPAVMADAAQLMEMRGADVIDINMGCPAKKVGQQNAGSALLCDLPRVSAILKATCQAVTIPVTLKTRIGFNDDTLTIERVAKMAEDAGIQALTVHGRTRAQRFNGVARYTEIAAVKQQVTLPIIVNGDIDSPEKAKQLIARYGFDGVMIGRAAQGNPWLLGRIRHALTPAFEPQEEDREALIREHITALHQLYGEAGVFIARKHLHWYFRQSADYARKRASINLAKTPREQLQVIADFLQPESVYG